MDAIVTQDLVKHYAGDIHAVNGISLSIPPGRIFGFLGANGSGKTTTVRVLTTLLRPTSGKAFVDGLDVVQRANEVRESIGVALQEAGLDELQTGRELLELQARLYGVPRRQVAGRAAQLLAIVDLEDTADRLIKTYSGGMKRRLDLAAALIHSPRIVFLDEPTTGLDPISRESIWRYIQQLNRDEGVTFFLTTQYLDEADRLAHDVAIIDAGLIVAQGSPQELKSSIGTDVVTVGIDGGEDLPKALALLQRIGGAEDVRTVDSSVVIYIREGSAAIPQIVLMLSEGGVRMREVTLARPTLDDVFLRKTGHHLEPTEPAAVGEPGS